MHDVIGFPALPRFHVISYGAVAAADWILLAATCGAGCNNTPAGVRDPQRIRKVRLHSRMQPQNPGKSSKASEVDWLVGGVMVKRLFDRIVK